MLRQLATEALGQSGYDSSVFLFAPFGLGVLDRER